MQQLDDQVAVITGGARGIGLGIASVLAGAGAHVVLADIDRDAANEAAAALRERGRSAEGLQTDVTERASVDALAAHVVASHGRIDILAANAGIYPSTPIAAIDDAIWDRVMDINVKGALHAAQACLPAMLERGYGRIVFSSSITGPITGQAGFAHYGASKAALLGLMRSIAVEVAASGVTVNAVMPGNVETPGLADTSEEHRAAHALGDPDGPLRHRRGRRLRRPLPRIARGLVHHRTDADLGRRPGAARGNRLLANAPGFRRVSTASRTRDLVLDRPRALGKSQLPGGHAPNTEARCRRSTCWERLRHRSR